jgi:hypothetical protein
MAVNYDEISNSVRVFVAAIVRDELKEGENVKQIVQVALSRAWQDSVRDSFLDYIGSSPKLLLDLEVAKVMLAANHSHDLLCLPPGMKPPVLQVDFKETISFETMMSYATPLSAIYLDRVCGVMDAFKALNNTKQAATANGEAPNGHINNGGNPAAS